MSTITIFGWRFNTTNHQHNHGNFPLSIKTLSNKRCHVGKKMTNSFPSDPTILKKKFLIIASFLFITSLIFNKMSNLLPFVAILRDFATSLTFLSFSEESISRVRSSVIKRQSASSLPVDLLYFLNSVFLVFL